MHLKLNLWQRNYLIYYNKRCTSITYSKDGEGHFIAHVKVAISDQFFGWLCGLGNKVKIVSPSNVETKFKEYLSKIADLYSEDD